MKLKSITLILSIFVFLLAGCATKSVQEDITETEEPNEKILTEDFREDLPWDETENVEPEVVEPTDEEIFIEDISNVFIKFTATPKIANVNRAFSGPYTVTVTDKNGVPLPDYILNVSYPNAKIDGKVLFNEIEVTTDENGVYSFTPAKQTFGCSEKITIYPTPLNDSVKAEALARGASADWKVRSDVVNKGAILFIWDFDEKNRPTNNSYELLSVFRNKVTANAGNAPVSDKSYIGKSLSTLYKENAEMMDDPNAFGYLIVGTVKFSKPIAPCDDGYLCSLVAEIEAVSMKNGKKVYSSNFTQESTGTNWNDSYSKCKKQLAEKIVDALVYGL